MRVLTLRVPVEWAELLDAVAVERSRQEGRKVTASEVHRSVLEALLYPAARRPARRRPPTQAPPAPAKARQRVTTAVGAQGPGGCRHPRADRQVHAWGSTCGLCGSRV